MPFPYGIRPCFSCYFAILVAKNAVTFRIILAIIGLTNTLFYGSNVRHYAVFVMTNDSELGCSYEYSVVLCLEVNRANFNLFTIQRIFNKVKTFFHNIDNLQLD